MTERVSVERSLATGDGGVRRTPMHVAVAADDADRVAAMIPEECTVSTRAPAPTDDVDLWIVDETTFERSGDALSSGDGARAAVLLIVDDRLPADRRAAFDDVVRRPLRPPIVRRRIENLLGLRGPRSSTTPDARVGIDCVNHPVVAVRIDDGARIVRAVNGAFEDAFGYDADAVVGGPLSEWVVPSTARENARELVALAARGERVERIVRRETATGRRDFVLRMVPSAADPGTVYVCYDDVTDERCRKQQVQVLNRVLRHNIRNGMNVILGNAEVLVDRVDDPCGADAARSIRDAAYDLVDLGETAGSLQTTWDGADRRILDAVGVVDRVRTELRRGTPTPDIRVEAPENCPVLADARLETAIRELLENAIQYAVGDEPVVVAVAQRGAWTDIRVSDRGPGLPDAERGVLRGDEETPLEHGSGLGLWVVNWIVTSTGGEITVEDNDPRGTTVTLSLPSGPRRSDRPPAEGGF